MKISIAYSSPVLPSFSNPKTTPLLQKIVLLT